MTTVETAGHSVTLSRTDKVLYPDDGITKGDVLNHYCTVAEVMLPHLRGRPLVLRRYPDGLGDGGFFQKEASDYFPDWIRTVEVPTRSRAGTVRHVVCDDEATLLYLANQACMEFHTWLSTVEYLDRPDRMVLDLDPAEGTDNRDLRALVRRVCTLFDEVGLVPFVQATGGRGFHVTAPLDGNEDYDTVRALVGDLAEHLAADDPDRLTTRQRRSARGDRIFLDVNRNAYGQTAITPYSLRARPHAPVATPLGTSELTRAKPNGHNLISIRRRLSQKPDPWADIAAHAGSAARARGKFDRLR